MEDTWLWMKHNFCNVQYLAQPFSTYPTFTHKTGISEMGRKYSQYINVKVSPGANERAKNVHVCCMWNVWQLYWDVKWSWCSVSEYSKAKLFHPKWKRQCSQIPPSSGSFPYPESQSPLLFSKQESQRLKYMMSSHLYNRSQQHTHTQQHVICAVTSTTHCTVTIHNNCPKKKKKKREIKKKKRGKMYPNAGGQTSSLCGEWT